MENSIYLKNFDRKIFLKKKTSFPEQAIYYFYKFVLNEKGVFNCYKFLYDKKWSEADVFISSKKYAIEYDGFYWHKFENLLRDEKKRKQFCNWGIKVIIIKESTENKIEDNIIFYNCYKDMNKNLSWAISKSSELLGYCNISFNVDDYIKEIFDMFIKEQYDKSFYVKKPKEAKDWDYEENGDLKPWDVSEFSAKKVHWKCKKGHKWVGPVFQRSTGHECFACYVQEKYDKLNSDLPGKFWL